MTDYVFHSQDGYRFHCKVSTVGEWYVKELIGSYCVVLIDPTDTVFVNGIELHAPETYFSTDTFLRWFHDTLLRLGIVVRLDDIGRYTFKSTRPITIRPSYHYHRLFGDLRSFTNDGMYHITSSRTTPIWYLVSNSGCNCVISTTDRDYYCGISLKVIMNYKLNDLLNIRNTEYKSKAVSNVMDLTLMDENFVPVRNESDLCITIHIDPSANTTSPEIVKCGRRELPKMIRKIDYETPSEPQLDNGPAIIPPLSKGFMMFPYATQPPTHSLTDTPSQPLDTQPSTQQTQEKNNEAFTTDTSVDGSLPPNPSSPEQLSVLDTHSANTT